MRPKRLSARPVSRCTRFALELFASLAFFGTGALAKTIAYTGVFLPGGFDFASLDFVDPPQTISGLPFFPATGAFADNDFSHEYMIDLALGRLFSIDVQTGEATLIDSVDTSDNGVVGMHWDPTSHQMFVIANDSACTSSTLYRLDVSNASMVEVGSTPGCINVLSHRRWRQCVRHRRSDTVIGRDQHGHWCRLDDWSFGNVSQYSPRRPRFRSVELTGSD